jgi:hypothetical protein
MMKKTAALSVGIAFLMSGIAYAKPDAVPGVGCPVCHVGPPQKKVLTQKAAAMFATQKDVAKCKECHSKGEGGKMVTKVPGK